MDFLYSEIEPYAFGSIKVSKLHTLYWECSGNPNGINVLVIHGGPGSCSDSLSRRLFNPDKFNIIQYDQRGCGKSMPVGELKENTTLALVDDIETLRKYLKINKWHLFGGSWGATLSLIYGINYPHSILTFILRGVFLGRNSDLRWIYQDGASKFFPEEFASYISVIPEDERSDLIRSYYLRISSEIDSIRNQAVKAWTLWELSCGNLVPSKTARNLARNIDFSNIFAKIESYFFYNKLFIEENYILNNIGTIKHIPTFIVNGRYDVICPVENAWELHKALDNSQIAIIPIAGHMDIEIAKFLVKYMDMI